MDVWLICVTCLLYISTSTHLVLAEQQTTTEGPTMTETTTYETTTTDNPVVLQYAYTCVSDDVNFCDNLNRDVEDKANNENDPNNIDTVGGMNDYEKKGHRGLQKCDSNEKSADILLISDKGVSQRIIRKCLANCAAGTTISCDEIVPEVYTDPTYTIKPIPDSYTCEVQSCNVLENPTDPCPPNEDMACRVCTGKSWFECTKTSSSNPVRPQQSMPFVWRRRVTVADIWSRLREHVEILMWIIISLWMPWHHALIVV